MELRKHGGLRQTTRQQVNKTTSGGFARATPELRNHGFMEITESFAGATLGTENRESTESTEPSLYTLYILYSLYQKNLNINP